MNSTDILQIPNPYAGGWNAFEVLLSLSVVFSGTTFLFTQFRSDLSKNFHARLIKYLSGQEALWSILCLVQCAFNSYYGYFYGGNVACQLQSIYMLFFILMNGFTLCIMAYSTERRVQLTQRGIRIENLPNIPEFHSH